MAIIVNITADTVDELHGHLTDLLHGLKDPEQSRLGAVLRSTTVLVSDAGPDTEDGVEVEETEAAPQQRRSRGRPRKNPVVEAAAPEPELPAEPVVVAEEPLADAQPEAKPNGANGETSFDDVFAGLPPPIPPSAKQDFVTAVNLMRDIWHDGGGPAVRELLAGYNVEKPTDIAESEGTTLLAMVKDIEAKRAAKQA